ncbi:MAG: hypothetical protein GY810_05065 [Aureispira sp.]|nr:hypothetical protein [Aureispira sp.]
MEDLLKKARPELQEILEELEVQRQKLENTKKKRGKQGGGVFFGCLLPIGILMLSETLDLGEENKHTLSVLDAGTRVTDTQLEDLMEEIALYLGFVDKLTKLTA